jgi:hypothetical protein
MQETSALYRSYPPHPDLPRPYHTLPSAAKAQKEQVGSESAPGSRAAGERVHADDSSGSSVDWSDDAPLIPRRRRDMRKRKASATDLAG